MPVYSGKNGIRISFAGTKRSINSQRRWIQYLSSEQWYKDMKVLLESQRNKKEILTFVRSVVINEIYSVYEPIKYNRTYNLLNSMKVEMLDSILAGLAIYSDPDIAPAIGTKSSDMAGASYAAFFEGFWDTFIPAHAEPFRPFVQNIVDFIKERLPQVVMEAWLKAAKKRAPRTEAVAE